MTETASEVLAIDLGRRTGWALGSVRPFSPASVISGVEDFRPRRFEGGGMWYLRFKRWLGELNGKGEREALYFEEVRRHAGVDAAHAYCGFIATLMAWCEAHDIPFAGVPVGTIKRFVTGRGNAGKASMVAAIRARGFSPVDDNEADAIALLLAAEGNHPETRTMSVSRVFPVSHQAADNERSS